MKKLSIFILTFILTVGISFAQPTLLTSNFIPSVGESQLYYVADTNSIIDPTIGANVVFNYSLLAGYGLTQTQYFVNPASTPNGGSFPTATYADTSDASASNIRYSQVFSSDSVDNIGFVAKVPTYGTIVATYNKDPEILMKFPFVYGDNYVDNYSGNFNMLSQNTDGNGNASVIADAWGQLKLPFGVVIDSVLRVKTVEHLITDTIFITTPFPITINPVTVNGVYINYYKPSISKFPLLSYVSGSITQDGNILDSSTTFLSQYPLLSVGVEEFTEANSFKLYPNPSTNNSVILSYDMKENTQISIQLMNTLGERIYSIFDGRSTIGLVKHQINTQNLSKGIYFIQISVDENIVTKKLIIQ